MNFGAFYISFTEQPKPQPSGFMAAPVDGANAPNIAPAGSPLAP